MPQKSDHYKGKIQCIDVIEQQKYNFNLGNAQKYLWRAGIKTTDSKDDLYKALDYLHRELFGVWYHEK